MISFDTNLIIRGIWSFLYVVFDNRLIGIHSNWEPTIRIVKIAIRFSINNIIASCFSPTIIIIQLNQFFIISAHTVKYLRVERCIGVHVLLKIT